MQNADDKTSKLSLCLDPIKYAERIPEFDGSEHGLKPFIDSVELMDTTISKYEEKSQHIIFNIIKNKIIGKAREILEIYNYIHNWADLKIILQNNFSDRRSSYELFDDLRSIKFKNNLTEFYNEIQGKLRKLNIKTEQEERKSDDKIKNNINTALSIFKHKIPEPMKSILTCRNPETIEEAFHLLSEGGYLYQSYPQQDRNPLFLPRSVPQRNINYNKPQTKMIIMHPKILTELDTRTLKIIKIREKIIEQMTTIIIIRVLLDNFIKLQERIIDETIVITLDQFTKTNHQVINKMVIIMKNQCIITK